MVRTEIEYKGDGMARVSLLFRRDGHDPEDLWIRSELERFPVSPKRILEWDRGGEPFEVLQYGQCVIGELMYDIEKHQLLCGRISELCSDEFAASSMSSGDREQLVSEVAKEFHGAAKIRWDNDDQMAVSVENEPLRERVHRLMAENAVGT